MGGGEGGSSGGEESKGSRIFASYKVCTAFIFRVATDLVIKVINN